MPTVPEIIRIEGYYSITHSFAEKIEPDLMAGVNSAAISKADICPGIIADESVIIFKENLFVRYRVVIDLPVLPGSKTHFHSPPELFINIRAFITHGELLCIPGNEIQAKFIINPGCIIISQLDPIIHPFEIRFLLEQPIIDISSNWF